MDSKQLIEEAMKARQKAYAPYSNFKVGAALMGQDGRIFMGCNVENASYGLTMCAERVAVVKAVSEGVTEFSAIALIADSDTPISPCGACRQVLAEFNPEMTVIMGNIAGEIEETILSELLPNQFRSHRLT
ncbi:cytidine deaminase [candidate division KSB1 bacterium]|nr:cytidine deaminase [candidate division KSB1 bacterium]